MNKFLVLWGVNALSLWVVDALMKSIYFADIWALLLTALVLTILNETLKPVLKFLSFPISVVTLGLFSLVINGAILYLAIAMTSANGSYINSFGMAVVASILLSFVNYSINSMIQ